MPKVDMKNYHFPNPSCLHRTMVEEDRGERQFREMGRNKRERKRKRKREVRLREGFNRRGR